jgi:hypothetical protein
MKEACRNELTKYCKDVPHGNARAIRYVCVSAQQSASVVALSMGSTLMLLHAGEQMGCVHPYAEGCYA